jgi:hypothetical protein
VDLAIIIPMALVQSWLFVWHLVSPTRDVPSFYQKLWEFGGNTFYAVRGLFGTCSSAKLTQKAGFPAFFDEVASLTWKGSQVRSLSRPPSFQRLPGFSPSGALLSGNTVGRKGSDQIFRLN